MFGVTGKDHSRLADALINLLTGAWGLTLVTPNTHTHTHLTTAIQRGAEFCLSSPYIHGDH